MKFTFVEIGTADFDTEAQKCFYNLKHNQVSFNGLSIEPLSIYYNRLPEQTNFYFKEQCAITETEKTESIYYIEPEIIGKIPQGLSKWRGCNSLGNIHPAHKIISSKKNIELKKLISRETVMCKKISYIINKYNIEEIDFLKIDTEGYDTIITTEFLRYISINKQFNLLPKKIQFEFNKLNNKNDTKNIISTFLNIGYSEIKCFGKENVAFIRK